MPRLQTIEHFEELRALEPEWNALLQRSRSDCIYLTWEWISCWWAVYGGRYQLLVVVVRDDDGQLRGLAPLMIGRGRSRLGRYLRRLMFIGQDVDTSPEYLDFIIEAGRESEIVALFCRELLGPHRGRWDRLYFQRVLDTSPSIEPLKVALAAHNVELRLRGSIVCHHLDMPAGYDAFLQSKSTHFRKRVRYNNQRLQRDGEVRYRFAPAEVSVDDAYERLCELNRDRFGDRGTSFRSPEYIEVHRRFCHAAAARGWLLLCLMEQNGRVIGAKYDYVYAGLVWGNQGGWAKELQQKNVGEILLGRLVEWTGAQGLPRYDFMGYAAAYKERWATGQHSMVEEIEADGLTVRAAAARRLDQAKQILKERLPPSTVEKLRRLRGAGKDSLVREASPAGAAESANDAEGERAAPGLLSKRGMLEVRCIENIEDLKPLAGAWDELLSESASSNLFLSWDWVSTWLEVYGSAFQLLVLVAEQEGKLRGIAPLMIRRGGSLISRQARTLMFIGQEVDVTPDYLDFIVRRGEEAEVATLLARELTGRLSDRWEFLNLSQLPRSSPNQEHLLSVLGEAGIEPAVIREDRCPYAELAPSWEAFLQAKSSGFRKQYKNKHNRLQRAGQVRYLLGGKDLPVEQALEEIVRLNRDRWQDAGASFRSDSYRRFHQLLVSRIAPKGEVALLLMELDGKIVAGRYDFVYDGKLWCYQGGWSPEHAELNLGDNMLGAIIGWGIDRGLREYDFLGGPAVYKDRWSTGVREQIELWGANRTGRAQLLRLLRDGRNLLRQELPERLRALRSRFSGEAPAPPTNG